MERDYHTIAGAPQSSRPIELKGLDADGCKWLKYPPNDKGIVYYRNTETEELTPESPDLAKDDIDAPYYPPAPPSPHLPSNQKVIASAAHSQSRYPPAPENHYPELPVPPPGWVVTGRNEEGIVTYMNEEFGEFTVEYPESDTDYPPGPPAPPSSHLRSHQIVKASTADSQSRYPPPPENHLAVRTSGGYSQGPALEGPSGYVRRHDTTAPGHPSRVVNVTSSRNYPPPLPPPAPPHTQQIHYSRESSSRDHRGQFEGPPQHVSQNEAPSSHDQPSYGKYVTVHVPFDPPSDPPKPVYPSSTRQEQNFPQLHHPQPQQPQAQLPQVPSNKHAQNNEHKQPLPYPLDDEFYRQHASQQLPQQQTSQRHSVDPMVTRAQQQPEAMLGYERNPPIPRTERPEYGGSNARQCDSSRPGFVSSTSRISTDGTEYTPSQSPATVRSGGSVSSSNAGHGTSADVKLSRGPVKSVEPEETSTPRSLMSGERVGKLLGRSGPAKAPEVDGPESMPTFIKY
ncbi:hypothetical protein BJ508DRAFT_376281 [Ascobolus immersus RN42]|uniref:WW domain-containing protein n=1 Tax=Ascobolus immersus RN42 TaxID=1160509 RepID=A0A3N4I8E1_ASCIM|nr:hypothetical protein BJ508DRAFT_376281 [Ascobolus immersus RN42]